MPPSLNDVYEKIGRLAAAEENAQRSRDLLRNEVRELNKRIGEMADALNALASRLGPVEELSKDYGQTKSRVLKGLAAIGVGNLGLGALGATLAQKWFGE